MLLLLLGRGRYVESFSGIADALGWEGAKGDKIGKSYFQITNILFGEVMFTHLLTLQSHTTESKMYY